MAKAPTGFARVVKAAAHLPGIEEATSYGTPALKVKGKLLCRMKEEMDDVLVLRCEIEEKALLMAAAPDIYFETGHYKGYPALLVRLRKISAKELKHRLELAWRMQAPKKRVAAFDAPSM